LKSVLDRKSVSDFF